MFNGLPEGWGDRFCDVTAIPIPWELRSGPGISIRAQDAWNFTRGSTDTTIAIIDEEFDVERLPQGLNVEVVTVSTNFVRLGSILKPAHGTLLSELIAGNREGYPGVAPGCRLLLIKLSAFSTEDEEAQAFNLALQHDAAAVCCAWGPPSRDLTTARPMPTTVAESIERLVRHGRQGRGALVLFAVGNDGCSVSLDEYASHDHVVAVGGIRKSGLPPPNMDHGSAIQILAPVTSDDSSIGGFPGHPLGTSGAAALAAAVAGLGFSVNPGLSPCQMVSILKRTSVGSPGYDGSRPSAALAGVVDAGRAVIEAISAAPDRPRRCRQWSSNASPMRPNAPSSERRSFKERRYHGGEHSLFSMTAAQMLFNLYRPGHPADSFYGDPMSAYTPAGGAPTYSGTVTALIDNFFDATPTTTPVIPTAPTAPAIAKYPCISTPAIGDLPYGYLVGLGADLYGTPQDLMGALTTPLEVDVTDVESGAVQQQSTFNSIFDRITLFNEEMNNDFQSDDWKIFKSGSKDPYSDYARLAKKNYSHFAGHNLLFYLSFHLLAVNDSIACGASSDPTAAGTLFTRSLVEEAFALHFLTDMFSSGHSRVPRWAFLCGNVPYITYEPVATKKMRGREADLISRLLHEHEGKLGCLVTNATNGNSTRTYFWKIYGDGSLRLAELDQADNLIYGEVNPGVGGSAPAVMTMDAEPIQWAPYMSPQRNATDNLRRFDLITGLICTSIADVFRHMATGSTMASSALGGPSSPQGLLGYILERIPVAMPIESGLSANVDSAIRDGLMTDLFSGADYKTTELSVRLGDHDALYETYQEISRIVKVLALKYISHGPDFQELYWRGKFDLPSTVSATGFEALWVNSQTTNLSTAFSSSAALKAAIPSIVGGTSNFAATYVNGPYNPGNVTLPTEWITAVQATTLGATLVANPDGVWGIDS